MHAFAELGGGCCWKGWLSSRRSGSALPEYRNNPAALRWLPLVLVENLKALCLSFKWHLKGQLLLDDDLKIENFINNKVGGCGFLVPMGKVHFSPPTHSRFKSFSSSAVFSLSCREETIFSSVKIKYKISLLGACVLKWHDLGPSTTSQVWASFSRVTGG